MNKTKQNIFHPPTKPKRMSVPLNFRVQNDVYAMFTECVSKTGWSNIEVFNHLVALAGPVLGLEVSKANEFLYQSLMRHQALLAIHKPTGKAKKVGVGRG